MQNNNSERESSKQLYDLTLEYKRTGIISAYLNKTVKLEASESPASDQV